MLLEGACNESRSADTPPGVGLPRPGANGMAAFWLRLGDNRIQHEIHELMTEPGAIATYRESLISRTFLQLTDTLIADFDIIDLLTILSDRCVVLTDADAAGILLVDAEEMLRVMAASSEQARLLELFRNSESGRTVPRGLFDRLAGDPQRLPRCGRTVAALQSVRN